MAPIRIARVHAASATRPRWPSATIITAAQGQETWGSVHAGFRQRQDLLETPGPGQGSGQIERMEGRADGVVAVGGVHHFDGFFRSTYESQDVGQSGMVLGVTRAQPDGAARPAFGLGEVMRPPAQVAHHQAGEWQLRGQVIGSARMVQSALEFLGMGWREVRIQRCGSFQQIFGLLKVGRRGRAPQFAAGLRPLPAKRARTADGAGDSRLPGIDATALHRPGLLSRRCRPALPARDLSPPSRAW